MGFDKSFMKQMVKEVKDKYGKGWNHMSDDQKENAWKAKMVSVVLSQMPGTCDIAQTIIRDMMEFTPTED